MLASRKADAYELPLLEIELVAAHGNSDDILGAETALQDFFRQRVLDRSLNCALQRPCTVNRVETDRCKFRQHSIVHIELDFHRRKPLLEIAELNPCDRLDVLFIEGMEHHHLVNAVDEFRTEVG